MLTAVGPVQPAAPPGSEDLPRTYSGCEARKGDQDMDRLLVDERTNPVLADAEAADVRAVRLETISMVSGL